ncbi:MAG: hypothetical protein ABEJ04_07880 [Halobacteriaceae archaeon]
MSEGDGKSDETGDVDEGNPSDTMRKRVPGNRAKIWVLLDLNRYALAAGLLACVFVGLVVLGAFDPASMRAAMKGADPVETLFQALVTAIVTGVTLVVTINQLVLSQELGAVGDQRERMEGAMSFREDVESVLDAPISPPEPAAFLAAVIDVTRARADDLADAVDESRDEEFRERVHDYVDSLRGNARQVSDRLDDAQFGTFEVLMAALNYNYSWKIYEARRLRNEHRESLTEETEDALDAVVEVLQFFGPAREHFKTLYFQWELINLSRAMMYAAVPALVVSVGGVLYLDNPGTVTGTTLGIDNLIWVVSAATTVALGPFVLLLVYVLRIATVAKRTLAIGPFVLRETERTDDIDWD